MEPEQPNRKFWFTQSALKDMERETTCPFRWKSQWLDGKIPFETNEFMDRGKYFEFLCIGGSARSDDEVTDLPRLRNGEKTAMQLRIEAQVAKFTCMFTPNNPQYIGHKIVDTQIEVRHNGRKGTIDFLTEDEDGTLWMWDLKLTSDAESTRTQYGYGNDWNEMDLMQLIHYYDLYKGKFNKPVRLALLVFDYSPSMNVKANEIVVTEQALDLKELRFTCAEHAVQKYEKYGWITIPSVHECSACPLKCSARIAEYNKQPKK